MLQRDNAGRYSNGPEAARFLDPARPDYVGGVIEMLNARLYGFWGSLTEALRTGEPQNEAKSGGDLFGTLYADPVRLEGFVRAMTGHLLVGGFDPRRTASAGCARPGSRTPAPCR